MSLASKLLGGFCGRKPTRDLHEVTVECGYRITDAGDVVRPDGSAFPPGHWIEVSDEHMRMIAERRSRLLPT